LHTKLADIEAIRKLFPVEGIWRRFEPLIIGIRKQGNSKAYEYFEYLYDEVKKREQQLQQGGAMNG
jgi:hypothetical protein